MIYCIMVEGGALNDSLRSLLFDTAQEMMEEGETRRTIKSGFGTGGLSTENEQISIGGVSGTQFKAELDTEWGSFKVLYMVRPARNVWAKDCVFHTRKFG